MQNFDVKNNYLLINNKKQIKKLWLENFPDDSENIVDVFLKSVFKNKKGVGAFLENELIAMILFLNSEIILKNKNRKSVYFYAVCTTEKYRNRGVIKNLFEFAEKCAKEQGYEVCFLVPENDGLFKMYEKFSFKSSICYEEKTLDRVNLYNKNTIYKTTGFCYDDYKQHRLREAENLPVIVWENDEFNFIFDKNRTDVTFIFSDSGYAVYEKLNAEILVHEICGNKEQILDSILGNEPDCKKLKLKLPVESSKTRFGMTLDLVGSNENVNTVYFGMPYR